jgi:glycosyltransferase involved in cell wall biosynthesis
MVRSQADILIWGTWPDPRTGGVSSVVHDLVLQVNRAGRDLILIVPTWRTGGLGPKSIDVMDIPARVPFDWRRAVANRKTFASIEHFGWSDRLGTLGGKRDRLARVGLIHYHSEASSTEASNGRERRSGSENHSRCHDPLARLIASRAGRRPKLVRTRHDDVQGGLDRFMRLTGIDPLALPQESKRSLIEGRLDLEPIIQSHVEAHRDTLNAEGWNDDYLDSASGHVGFVTDLWRRWRLEHEKLDAVVCLTDRALRELAELLEPERPDVLVKISNGTSFPLGGRRRIEFSRTSLRSRARLQVHRGGSAGLESIVLQPNDRIVLFVGRATRDKGIHELAQALVRLYHGSSGTIKGIFVGDFNRNIRRELSAIDPRHSPNYLLFTGHIRDPEALASFYVLSDVTVLASHVEAFNLVGLESYRVGTPCIVAERTSMADAYLDQPRREGRSIALPVARAHRDGLRRFHGVDVDSLVRQIASLLDDANLARRLSESGKAYVEAHYTDRRMGAAYLDLYDRLLTDSNSAS